MKITLLGTGCPEPNANRASSGYLVEIGNDCILLDCGGGVFDRLLQAGKKPSDITHLFFSHLHTDHMMDYARLVHAAWDEGGQPIKVFGPPPIRTIHERLFGEQGVFAFDLIARTEHEASQAVWLERGGTLPRPWPTADIQEIEAGFTFTRSIGLQQKTDPTNKQPPEETQSSVAADDDWTLTCCTVIHAQPQLDCLALSIECNGKRMVYAGDSAIGEPLKQLASHADLLIHWCYRLTDQHTNNLLKQLCPDPVEIGKLAAQCHVQQLILTHLRSAMDNPETKANMLAGAQQHFSGEISIAEDLQQVVL